MTNDQIEKAIRVLANAVREIAMLLHDKDDTYRFYAIYQDLDGLSPESEGDDATKA